MTRLAFVTGRDISRSDDGTLHAYLAHARLINLLAKEFDRIEVIAPETELSVRHDGTLDDSVSFRPLPHISSTAEGLRRTVEVAKALRSYGDLYDKALVQIPFPSPYALLTVRKPSTVYGVGDVQEVVRHGRSSSIYNAAAWGSASVFRQLARRSGNNVVTNGSALLDRFGGAPGEWMISSGLLEQELGSVVRQRPADGRFRVLFVGYIRAEKGFHILTDAVVKLLDDGADVELRIVAGDVSDRAGLGNEWIAEQLGKLPADRVHSTGHLPFGEALFQEFADADVLVLPTFSEGTPRVLVEARAFGCPVVASRVGGVPDSVTDGHDGLLVEAGDPDAIVASLQTLINDPTERQRLIDNGHESVRNFTVESMATRLAEAVRRTG